MTHISDLLMEHVDTTLHLTLNRPEKLNALTPDLLHEAAGAVDDAADNPDVRAIVLTGTGKAFTSGGDLTSTDWSELSGTEWAELIDSVNRFTRALRAVPKPVLAAINGPVVGAGCSVALAADVTIATESAYLLLTFTNIGLMPDGGATTILPANIGHARTARMAMLAEPITASTAADWGLVARTVPDDEFDAEVQAVTAWLANGPTQAFAATKRALNATTLEHLDTALTLEREGQSTLVQTRDFTEGIAAFQEKRLPRFSGA